jgi:hypothetical protein
MRSACRIWRINSRIEAFFCPVLIQPPAATPVGVAHQLQQLHLLDLDPNQFKGLRQRDRITEGLGKVPQGIKGGSGLGPAPETPRSGMELLPVLAAGGLIVVGVQEEAMTPEPKL